MNIREAKEEIKNSIIVYFDKDEDGEYMIPIEKQRPVFLMGPPGIGKTAIMEQIADELGVGLLTYSMTHHTRQSALGLPFISHKVYGGKEYDISEYTMSEIIASIYDQMEETGKKEGILFLDEINCVSETLAPIMLQFLQYKVFGRHRVPDGWIIVTAGNPPEYNNSVKEYDIVTLDRLKKIDVEEDYEAWKEYAIEMRMHPAVLSYLELKQDDFYLIESTVDGKHFVTARGWEDLSTVIKRYEANGIEVRETLISQYIQHPRIASDFAVYYDLFNKYKSDYQVIRILEGTADDEIVERAKNARFDERIALLGLLIDTIFDRAEKYFKNEDKLRAKVQELRSKKEALAAAETPDPEAQAAYAEEEAAYKASLAALKAESEMVLASINNAFTFCEKAFGEGQEILILVTELTSNSKAAKFIAKFGSEKYFQHNKELLFYERHKDIIDELAEMNIIADLSVDAEPVSEYAGPREWKPFVAENGPITGTWNDDRRDYYSSHIGAGKDDDK